MKPDKNTQTYSLIHSQGMVRFMWKYSLHMQSTQIPAAVLFDEDIDFRVLARAVNIEIERNDCLRLRIFRDKMDIKQFFLPEYKLDKILVRDFSSKEELTAYFDELSGKKLDVFGGETFRIVFFRLGEKCGIYFIVSHMIMDAAATFIFYNDLIAVYDAIRNNTAMPRALSKFEDIIKKELSDERLKDYIKEETAILEEFVAKDKPPMYCGINGTKVLDRERRLRRKPDLTAPSVYLPVRDKALFTKLSATEEESRIISDFIAENTMSAEWVIQAGLRIYLSKLNNKVNDTEFWVLCPRRRTVKEKRCGGTLASPMPWREILPGEMTFKEAVMQLAETQSFLFRHCDVPFTAMRDSERRLFGYNMAASCNSMMFSFLPSSQGLFGGREYEYLGFNMGHYVMPLYTITNYSSKTGLYRFSYIHRKNNYSVEEITAFHRGVVKTIIKGILNPQMTIDEIMEEEE